MNNSLHGVLSESRFHSQIFRKYVLHIRAPKVLRQLRLGCFLLPSFFLKALSVRIHSVNETKVNIDFFATIDMTSTAGLDHMKKQKHITISYLFLNVQILKWE
jgi:hypothetical protein